jgi:hypothetical protein
VVDGEGEVVVPERTWLRTGRVTLSRCSHGPLFAEGVCRPVSLAARGRWRFERPTFASDSVVFGGNRPSGVGVARGEIETNEESREPLDISSAVVALRSAYVALVGPVRVEGRVGRLVSFTFTEEVSHEPA